LPHLLGWFLGAAAARIAALGPGNCFSEPAQILGSGEQRFALPSDAPQSLLTELGIRGAFEPVPHVLAHIWVHVLTDSRDEPVSVGTHSWRVVVVVWHHQGHQVGRTGRGRGPVMSVDIATAGRAFGIGRTKSHELARNG